MLAIFLTILPLMVFTGCSGNDEIKDTRFMMGTLVEFTVITSDDAMAQEAIHVAADTMQSLSDRFTIYGTQANIIKTFNQSPIGIATRMPEDIDALLHMSLKIQQQSMQAFSPTLGSLSVLWGFSGNPPPTRPPAASQIASLLTASTNCLIVDQHLWQHTQADCHLDLGGIAKGYIIDRGIEELKKHGIRHAMINAGGDIRIIGSHGKRPWHIGIRHPRKAGEVIATLDLEGDTSIVTSGDYERYYEFEHRRYHHILNPATGYPAMASQSATVIAHQASLADAWSTALFVLGKAGLPALKQQGLNGILVDDKGEIYSTDGVKQYLQHPG